MIDFEKLGAFYLGRRVETATDTVTEEPVLYDAKDLTTHAVIIGMTGSGKTGLGISLLEEAAIDHIPVIAIDPKGDLGNLLLTFPDLRAEDFRPWVNERQASDRGITADAFATEQAALWKKGLADWGQDGARIAKLRASADLALYTPGSNAGLPISVLQSFAAPAAALLEDTELYRERVQATATGVLSLVGIDSDPAASREHILLSRILDHAWQERRSLDLPGLIAAIQNPPFTRVGVMDLESFFTSKDRFALALRLNNLLAAPGFDAWLQGEPLNIARLLHTEAGKPRVSILSIAHLGDAERMFFVSMLLNELIAWMRTQPGTASLRAILYMDEIFGYMPPVANPPSKLLLLTLLKQARAYGLGLALATQNPVDLDYKGLSNTGSWFIGRLQTERDKARVMEGLEGVSQGGQFDRAAMERTLAGLGKRRFLLHNVHEEVPVIFNTRWAMSYLAGPMTREQIRTLAASRPAVASSAPEAPVAPRVSTSTAGARPVLPPGIRQFHRRTDVESVIYFPRVVASARVTFSSARHGVDEQREFLLAFEPDDARHEADWDQAETLPFSSDELLEEGRAGASYAECPTAAANEKSYPAWESQLKRWLRQNENVRLLQSKRFRLTSTPAESEGEFRVRLQQTANEERDRAVAAIRKRYGSKATTLENRLLRAEQAVSREALQANQSKVNTAVSFGTAILGAVLGRKRISATTATKVGSAIRSAGSARQRAADVERAKETADKVRADMEALNAELETEVDALETAYDAQTEELTEILIKPKVADVQVPFIGLLWMPYRERDDGRIEAL